MSGTFVPTSEATTLLTLEAEVGCPPGPHLDSAASSVEPLGRKLQHYREQFNRVCEITEHISDSQDPAVIEETLLRHLAAMLRAGAVFLDQAGCCTRVELGPLPGRLVELPTDRVRAVLAWHVEAVRRAGQAVVVDELPALDGTHVLLGALPRADAETGVVVTLRDSREPPFDSTDLLATRSVLMYGAQILNNVGTLRRLQRTALETVCVLVNAIDAKDNYTSDHSERVGGLARLTGEAMRLPKEQLQVLEWAGLLHDVGKIGVGEHILNKPGRLTDSEFAEMKKHPRIGHDMLKPVGRFEPVLGAVLHHHENCDGSGYPDKLGGTGIPLEARVIHVADIFDALTTCRPYRNGYSLERAVQLMEQDAGRVTDAEITRVFVDALHRYLAADPGAFRARFGHLAAGSGAN